MGSYCELYIADYPILYSKSYVNPIAMTLFRETDKYICERSVGSRNPIVWGHGGSDEDEIELVIEYRISAGAAKDRLDVMGFTIDRAKCRFNESRQSLVRQYSEYLEFDDCGFMSCFYRDLVASLERYTYEDYIETLRAIMLSGLAENDYIREHPDTSPLTSHILSDDSEELFWGFDFSDIRYLIRIVLEACSPESCVTYDITELVHSGYYEVEDVVCDRTLKELTGVYPINSKIIIVTEGTTDTEILAPSLKLLHPHLYDYYSFMDFGMRPQGGVGQLVNTVKSFAGAGIENRTIFLFDNDTAAHSAITSLNTISIPDNIAVLHYPNIELAVNYPTLGPSGMANMDINGLACSIELYLGRDVLETDGCLEPIQWKGYDEKLKRYQGEIMHKSDLKSRFLAKLSRCENDARALRLTDWSGISRIFSHIFQAFNS